MQHLLDQIVEDCRPLARTGQVAQYIPALSQVDPSLFGLAVALPDGQVFEAGEAREPFSIQSISKLFSLALAIEWCGTNLWDRVGREPSGMRFNSLIQLETEKGRPRNPFINAGAIATTDVLMDLWPDYPDTLLDQLRQLAENPKLSFDLAVHRSEIETGDLNRAMAFVLKAHGNLAGDPMAVTSAYFKACSIRMSARDLARAAMFLVTPQENSPFRGEDHAPRLRAIMRTCGLYDQSGEFAFQVGLPGKSGVGGGVLAVSPGSFAACAWSPPLDKFGNSVAGQAALERLAAELC